MAYSILGTVSPSSLELDDATLESNLLDLWSVYLESQLREHHKDAQKVDIKIVPFGGTRVFAQGDSAPSRSQLEAEVESIMDHFCFHLEAIVPPDLHLDTFPKAGDTEC